jgi:ribose-phosphate pyrophosphokinase
MPNLFSGSFWWRVAMMRLYSAQTGDIPYHLMTYPDGQRHLRLQLRAEGQLVTIEARIANADELFDVLLAKDALSAKGCAVSLDIRYLLGARTDRRMGTDQPFTLQIVAQILLTAGFRKIRVLDPHSPSSLALLDATAVYPHQQLDRILALYHIDDSVVIAPDVGATDRVRHLVRDRLRILQGHKHREALTGNLSRFTIDDASFAADRRCLMIDDICDGGRTFTALADILHHQRAMSVDLFVTHGIFSHGVPLIGIQTIYTTDSYYTLNEPSVTVLPIHMGESVKATV